MRAEPPVVVGLVGSFHKRQATLALLEQVTRHRLRANVHVPPQDTAVSDERTLELFYDAEANVVFLVSPFALDLHAKLGGVTSAAANCTTRGTGRKGSGSPPQHPDVAWAMTRDCWLSEEADAQFDRLAVLCAVCSRVYFFQDVGAAVPTFDLRYLSLFQQVRAFNAGEWRRQRYVRSAEPHHNGVRWYTRRQKLSLSSRFCRSQCIAIAVVSRFAASVGNSLLETRACACFSF